MGVPGIMWCSQYLRPDCADGRRADDAFLPAGLYLNRDHIPAPFIAMILYTVKAPFWITLARRAASALPPSGKYEAESGWYYNQTKNPFTDKIQNQGITVSDIV